MTPFDSLRSAAHEITGPPSRAAHLTALILGSGMGPVTSRIKPQITVPFSDVPGMVPPSVAGHGGQLILGEWVGQPVLVFVGRLHFYEGHSWDRVVQPVKIAADLGATSLLLTNAAGGIGTHQDGGTLMALTDHIECNQPYFWRLPGPGGLGASRPSPYSSKMNETLLSCAHDRKIALFPGIYAAVTGPCYETPAEIRALKGWGADAVGMSTAREAQTGFDLGLECAAVSLIANRAAGLSAKPLSHKEVLETVAATANRLADLIEEFLTRV